MIPRLLRVIRHRATVAAVVHVMAIRVVALAGNVCAGLLTAAFLGPDGRGEQSALGIAPLVLASLCGLGLHASLVYNLRGDPDRGSRYFGAALVVMCITSLVAMAAGFLLIPIWLDHYSDHTIAVARLFLLSIPLGVLTPLFGAVLEANGQFGVANRVLYFQSLGTLAILAILAPLGWLTPDFSAAAYIVPGIPSFAYLLTRVRRVLRPRLTLAAPFPRVLLRYGLRLYGVDVLGVLSGYFDQVLIVFLLAPAAMGAYAVALSLSRVLNVAQGAVATVLFPSIAAREPARVVEMVARATRVTAVVNIAGAIMIAVAGPSLLLLLYGARFAAAIAPFIVLLGEAVLSSAARTLGQAFSGTGRPSAVTALEVAGVATSLSAMLILVPSYGIVGAACASLLGGVARLGFVLASFRKILGIELPSLVISRADVAWVTGH